VSSIPSTKHDGITFIPALQLLAPLNHEQEPCCSNQYFCIPSVCPFSRRSGVHTFIEQSITDIPLLSRPERRAHRQCLPLHNLDFQPHGLLRIRPQNIAIPTTLALRLVRKPVSPDAKDAFADTDAGVEEPASSTGFGQVGACAELREELVRLEVDVLGYELVFLLLQLRYWSVDCRLGSSWDWNEPAIAVSEAGSEG